ncbi:alanine racemase [Solwaraspora sp. WMMD406]|uniref:alanine racemase n=1 Tax=Solwaraspora sp. WMMD406 TaxID=3016095 RepID=UPI0024168BC9|nr:alanine racemase [Solwaraspora sp. WMMD406]MDG4764928.1 alanine racemase [Solwaraspora sp. WMMD406]
MATLLDDHRALLVDLLDGLGSPLHVVLPEVFEENVAALRQAFAETGAEVDILFAKKANKADCFVRSAAVLGVGIDAASTAELVKALAGGVPGHRIGISGPEKDDTLHALAVQHDCLVAIDSISELRRLAATARLARRQVRVLLRARTESQPTSRFGMAAAERDAAVDMCLELTEHVSFRGFSFHLNGYSPEERAAAANEMIEHCLDARRRGAHAAELVDIGGGLPMRYVDPGLWDEFVQQNEPGHYHPAKTSKGLYFYPYGGLSPTQAARMIMSHPVDGDESLSAKAARHRIRFIVEPGRSLLDQAGFTMYRVQQVDDRRDTDGYAIVTVTGNSLNLCEQWFNTDYLPDPLLLSAQSVADEMFPASVAGSTCLENDMVTWRKIGFPRPVRPGDQLVYLNTAGYHSDFLESRFHDTALPLKAVLRLGDAAPRWRLDGI